MPVSLPDMPRRIAALARDRRGFPVPYFVQWLKDGERAPRGAAGAEPDFRYADADFRARAFRFGFCWTCGQPMGRHRVYVIGPMCVISRTTMEPANHRDCAEFAAAACPFLTKPRMRRNDQGLDPEASAPGIMIARNPGCVCLYQTEDARAFADGAGGWLINLGPPARVDWRAEGREATRAEIEASIDGGYPILMKLAQEDGDGAERELEARRRAALRLLPAA